MSERRTLGRISKADLPKFQRLFRFVEMREGSQNKARKELGLSNQSMYALLNGERLTDKQARRILEGYRSWKARDQAEMASGKPEGVTA